MLLQYMQGYVCQTDDVMHMMHHLPSVERLTDTLTAGPAASPRKVTTVAEQSNKQQQVNIQR